MEGSPPTPPAESDAPGRQAAQNQDGPETRALFPIVGVGASAGGLEALREFLEHLRADTGFGFVLVQHLDPHHDSALTELLSRVTSMPVREVTDRLPVEPDHVYVIPPNARLALSEGVLMLQPRTDSGGAQRSIDFFFHSLAQDRHDRAIGVVLSGTATDGTLGLEAIKAEGGITFAQDDSAKYDSMPRSAAAAGADFVLRPSEIAQELSRIAAHPFVREASGQQRARRTGPRRAQTETRHTPPPESGYEKILLLLRNHSGVDFSAYKAPTIERRIGRRLVVNKQNTLASYAAFLRRNTNELDALFSDLLISVTSFFRDPEAFDVLARKVFPALLRKGGHEPTRMWVLGCSTGQEAYSLAMAFTEVAEKDTGTSRLQIFATDLNDALLDKARQGLYPKSIAQDVSNERLRRFFVEEDGGYRVVKSLRERVIFARQNAITDPPFSRMDLVSCRNLLIYLDQSLQQKVFPAFHYALKPHGFLFLGASESISGFTELFEPIAPKQRIYARKGGTSAPLPLPARADRGDDRAPARAPKPGGPMSRRRQDGTETLGAELTAQREADRITLNQFAPPGVLVNSELQIVQFRGATGDYLAPPTGKASFDVIKMAREGLMLPLRAAINEAKKVNKTVRRENIPVNHSGQTTMVNVEVIPLRNLRDRSFLILFENVETAARRVAASPVPTASRAGRASSRAQQGKQDARQAADLERELAETREYAQAVQEEHDAATEELQAANEEAQSANEELQSVNEELETSKEELESTNEELTTVNDELAHRNTELNRLNSDLVNLQTSSHLAIVLLGRDLTIRRFSEEAERLLSLTVTDVGRRLGSIRHDLDSIDVETIAAAVIREVREQERDVQDQTGHWYSLRVRPYLTLDNKVDGAVVVLVDIDELKRSEQEIDAARRFAEAIIRTARDPLLILDGDLRITSANAAFYSTFKLTPAETEKQPIYELAGGQWNIPKLRRLLEEILPRGSVFNDFEVTHHFAALGRRTMLVNARGLRDQGDDSRILVGIQDVTELLQFQDAHQSQIRYEALVNASAQIVWTTDASGAVVEDSPSWRSFTGQTVEQRNGLGWLDALHPDDRERVAAAWSIAIGERTPIRMTYRLKHHSGSWRWTSVRAVPILNLNGSVREWIGMNSDITDRKQAEEALERSHAELRTYAEELTRFNRVAVGRELRMIQLKKEVNALGEELGKAPLYPLEFEKDEDNV